MLRFFSRIFKRNKNTITASMASVPWRIEALEKAVYSIIDQVDKINVYLNGWNEIPTFLKIDKINAVMSQNEIGDLGAKGKFYWCEKVNGIHLTIDDDILYPQNYVEEIIHQLSRYPDAVVSYHGSILNYPDFKKRNNKTTHFARACTKDCRVTFVGTGVLAYNTTTTKISFSGFQSAYWADGWFSKQVREQGQRCIALRHKESWLKPIDTNGPDIWSMNRSTSAAEEINTWIRKYSLWDEMTLFSERIRDRNLRWWIHKEKVQHKNVGGKINGQKFAKSLGVKVPETYSVLSSPNDLPFFDEFGGRFVIKPDQGYSNKNVYLLDDGQDMLDNENRNREEIIAKLKAAGGEKKQRILIEELLIPWDGEKRIPRDYKFYTFGSNIAYCQIIERHSRSNPKANRYWFVDEDFKTIEKQIMNDQVQATEKISKPDCWGELVEVCKLLGGELNRFTRIDLYATNRGAVFGEFTPTPHGGRGFTKFADRWLGDIWKGREGAESLSQSSE